MHGPPMAKGLQTARDIMALILNGEVPRWVDSDRYVSLHSGEPSTQSDHEVTYTGYRRQFADIDTFGFENEVFVNKSLLTFPVSVGGGLQTVSHIAIGTSPVGPGQLLYTGKLKAPVTVKINDRIEFNPRSIVIIED
jgi:hypothetical protein